MSKELLELMNKIKAQKELVKNLVNENKIDEAKVAKEELKNLSDKFDLLYDLEAEKDEEAKNKIKDGEGIKVLQKTKIQLLNLLMLQEMDLK